MSKDIIEIINELSRPFPQEVIHWRAQTVAKGRDGSTRALALAYIDSRDVMDRLDHVTEGMWQTEHFDAGNGRLGCRIGIKVSDEWVWKSDGAGETQVEAEKGAFSGAIKRAAVSWGVGRYLYDLENTWVPCDAYEQGGKLKFKKFTGDPWDHVKNRAAFTGKQGKSEKPKREDTPEGIADRIIGEVNAVLTRDDMKAIENNKETMAAYRALPDEFKAKVDDAVGKKRHQLDNPFEEAA